MSNDPRDLSGGKLQDALRILGSNHALRAELLLWFIQNENKILCPEGSVRELVTGPIVDAMHINTDQYEKKLKDGTKFKFLFRTKIARDFLMSKMENPSHVWEPQTTKLLQILASQVSGDVLVGGAYFGDHAVLLAKQIHGSGRVLHGFEPNQDQANMFAENLKINHLDNVIVNRLGLWSNSSDRLRLTGFDSFANSVLARDEEDSFQTVSIDDYLNAKNARLGLIQMDIEGAELEALKGAKNCLETSGPDIVFEVHRAYVDWSEGLMKTELCEYLSRLGYHIFAIRDFNGHREMGNSPIELIPANKVYLSGPPHGFNMLAIRDTARLKSPDFLIVENVSPKLLAHKDPQLHHPVAGLLEE